MDLIGMAKGYLGREVSEKMGGLFGESAENTQKAVDAAVPAIFGGLINKASTDEGAADIFKQVEQNDGGLLDNFGDILGGGNHQETVDQGNNMLSGLLGNNLGGVMDMIGKVGGIGKAASGGIMGMVTSLIMGLLGKQQSKGGLDVGGLVKMLTGQKKQVANLMPDGMGTALGIGDFGDWGNAPDLGDLASGAADAVGDAVGGAVDAAGDAADAVGDAAVGAAKATGRAVGSAADAVGDAAAGAGRVAADGAEAAASGAGSLFKILLPLLIIGGLIFLVMNLLKKDPPEPTPPKNPGIEVPKLPQLNLPSLNLDVKDPVAGVKGLFEGATGSLKSITNVETAKAALPNIEGITKKLDDWSAPIKGLTGDLQTGVTDLFKTSVPAVEKEVTRINGIEGVKDVAGTALDALLNKAKGFLQ